MLTAPLGSIIMDLSPEEPPFRVLYLPHQTTSPPGDDAILCILHSSVCATTTEITFHFKYMHTF